MMLHELTRSQDYDVEVLYSKSAGQVASVTSDYFKMICVTHGTLEFWVEDRYYRASGGDILLVPRGAMVGSTLKQRGCPCGQYTVWISRRFMNMLSQNDSEASLAFDKATEKGCYLLRLPVTRFEELYSAIENVVAECNSDQQLNREIAAKSQLCTMLVKLNRMVGEFGEDALLEGDKSRLVPVLGYIHEHCTEPLTVERVAEMFGYSSSHLAHSFKKQIGTSLYHYVLLRRLQIGREAMLKGTPVKEAYQLCGFGDYAGFYRAFTKEFGMSPQQYRKRNA